MTPPLQVTGYLPHILVLNKRDRVGASDAASTTRAIRRSDRDLSQVVYTNAKDNSCRGVKKVRR